MPVRTRNAFPGSVAVVRSLSRVRTETKNLQTLNLQVFRLLFGLLGGEYEILSRVLYFFCSLNINILHYRFCLDCAIFVPNLSRERTFNISILFEKIRQNLSSYICTSGMTCLLDNAPFLQQTIDGAMLFSDSVLL